MTIFLWYFLVDIMKFHYTEKESKILGHILKPLIYIEIFSEKHGLWCGINNAMVDTGADITLISRDIGEELVNDIFTGTKASMKGITHHEVDVYIHDLKLKVIGKEFTTKVAIANSEEVPILLGRFGALDLFDARFVKGKEFVLD